MARQHVDYQTSALSPPNAPADDGLDTGSADPTAIRPVIDGQPAQAAVFKRPSENLRTRTEKIRTELENLKYLSDADRALLITGSGLITWNGPGPGGFPLGTFQMQAGPPLTIRSFLAPATSIPSRLKICDNTIAQITFRTVQQAGTAPRAYSGANDITIDFQHLSVGTGTVVVTATGTPANNIHVQYDSHLTTYTTVNQSPTNSLIQQFNASAVAIALGVEAVFEGGGTPPEVGFPTPPVVSAAAKIDTYISAPEKATRYMSGAADAEKHVIPESQVTAFFSDPLNELLEGDTVCIRYEDLVMSPTDGGRRQSIADLPENNLTIPVGSLFLLRRFPERLPLAIPLCTVEGSQLIFLGGRGFQPGEVGFIYVGSGFYQGSGNNFANSTSLPGGALESVLDDLVMKLGSTVSPTGAERIGIQAITDTPYSTGAGTVHNAIGSVLGVANGHITNYVSAHGAAAITANTVSATPYSINTTSVDGQLGELITQLNDHANDTVAAHAATAISAAPTVTGLSFNTTGTDVQAAVFDLAYGLGGHLDNTVGAHNATAIAYTPVTPVDLTGFTQLGAAVNELDDKKASIALANSFAAVNTFTQKTILNPTAPGGVAGELTDTTSYLAYGTVKTLKKFVHNADFRLFAQAGSGALSFASPPFITGGTPGAGLHHYFMATTSLPLNAKVTGINLRMTNNVSNGFGFWIYKIQPGGGAGITETQMWVTGTVPYQVTTVTGSGLVYSIPLHATDANRTISSLDEKVLIYMDSFGTSAMYLYYVELTYEMTTMFWP